MLSKNIQDAFLDFEGRNKGAKKERLIQGVFIDIALTIARIRKSMDLSQLALARILQTSRPTISRWESPGYSGYTLSKLVEIADALGHVLKIQFLPKDTVTNETLLTENAEWRNFQERSHASESIKQHEVLSSTPCHTTSGSIGWGSKIVS